jgi:saccharopine dehydrogenase-like NADP-dependent oxidoreductase
LASDPGLEVTIADVREGSLSAAASRAERLGVRLGTARADLTVPAAVTGLVREGGYDVVLGALSSRIGFAALGAVIEAGRDYCDISFMSEDFTAFDRAAREKGVTCLLDFGVAPGMSHMLAAYGSTLLDDCAEIEIYVGGLPRERRWPFEYKAAFAPSDVVEEYVRPSRLVEHGRVVTRPALSEPELMDFAGIGTLEAFNTDGLRSLCQTLRDRVPMMKEKTLRYPGHIGLMRAMREAGLFSQQTVTVQDDHGRPVRVRPLDVTSACLFPHWTYAPGEEDLTVMRVIARGTKAGEPTSHTWDLFDTFDRATGATSMARTTAFPCAIMARLVASGRFKRPGVVAPELVGLTAGMPEEVLGELAKRGVRYTHHLGR